jgi:hypothetical protein
MWRMARFRGGLELKEPEAVGIDRPAGGRYPAQALIP